MTRALTAINLIGVLALAALCAVQWRGGNEMAHTIAGLQTTVRHQADTIDQQTKTLAENAADLDEFRQRLSASETLLKDVQRQLVVMTGDRDRVTAERDQLTAEVTALKSALDKWMAAVKADEADIKDRDDAIKSRDAVLHQANDQLQTLAAQRNDAVTKYNDLVNQYNALVKQVGNKSN